MTEFESFLAIVLMSAHAQPGPGPKHAIAWLFAGITIRAITCVAHYYYYLYIINAPFYTIDCLKILSSSGRVPDQ
jgi:hypothetical protein